MIDLLYIASPSYSGSTLLTFLLNTHPAVATVGELKWGPIDLKTYRCSCGTLLRKCGFWKQVEEGVRRRGAHFDLERPATDFRCRDRRMLDRIVRAGVRGPVFEGFRDAAVAMLPPCRRTWATIREVNRAAIETILALQGGSVFLDGSKDPVRLKYLYETCDYSIRVIHLVRDGRAVVSSAIKNAGADPAEAAGEWLNTHRQAARLRRLLGGERLLTVRYEDLCADVAGAVAGILRFAGLPPHPVPEDYRSVPHHILGNRMRLLPARPVQPDESWRARLGAAELRTFERIAGAANNAYRYV